MLAIAASTCPDTGSLQTALPRMALRATLATALSSMPSWWGEMMNDSRPMRAEPWMSPRRRIHFNFQGTFGQVQMHPLLKNARCTEDTLASISGCALRSAEMIEPKLLQARAQANGGLMDPLEMLETNFLAPVPWTTVIATSLERV